MKRIVVFAILTMMIYGVQAQNNLGYYPVFSIHDPHFGITFGPQATSFHSDSYDSEFQFGFFLGGSFSLPLSKRFSLEPQLVYSRKGGKGDYYINNFYEGSVRFKLHYLETPLLLNIHTKSVVDIIIGGYTGFLVDTNFDYSTYYYYGYGELDNDQFEKMDLGLITGIGINMPNGKIVLKYSHGLSDVAKDGNAYLFLEGAKNQSFSFSYIGYIR
ncbi:porin family protein [Muricauda sp. 334s03]|uniref:Porin family protein n=1 Tax=Flagellimonas yonaguniensis TaxID=3031325 RepID=A0ABT5XXX3_9FLAO|nr:porin family protein [[Muricauda] yonaguniensis]MDF0715979.1 porin family protein [[Muricauda] yonaguniensis]